MNVIEKYKELVAFTEGLDYTNTREVLQKESLALGKHSFELSLIVMLNALIKAPEYLSERLVEIVEQYLWYEGSFSTYVYIKNKLKENKDNEQFFYYEVFENLLEILEEKYSKLGIDLKRRYEMYKSREDKTSN
ncbi:hypothetical protein [Capnocytophaga sp. oral taxon 878]|uniref:hypothetical protein n=1 Tax=Capnocytophaga sp. oral taxon 878 TaxID=1316596 RepID=UPI000D0443D9|nr:hypothetical protein [Capnocytophaga sp. oral taxon 878]AVM49527.1 hypothetical protein C4H12_03055 [Capnocytophaga sp. oral taxon 878]